MISDIDESLWYSSFQVFIGYPETINELSQRVQMVLGVIAFASRAEAMTIVLKVEPGSNPSAMLGFEYKSGEN
jgi:hypothetical protein